MHIELRCVRNHCGMQQAPSTLSMTGCGHLATYRTHATRTLLLVKSGADARVFVMICRTVDAKVLRRSPEKDHCMKDDARMSAPRRKVQNSRRENPTRKAARSQPNRADVRCNHSPYEETGFASEVRIATDEIRLADWYESGS